MKRDQKTIVRNGVTYTVKRSGGVGLLIGRDGEQANAVVAPNADLSRGDPEKVFGYIVNWNRQDLPRPKSGGLTLHEAVDRCIIELEKRRTDENEQEDRRLMRTQLEQKGWAALDEYISAE